MFVFVLFCWATFHIYRALAQGECTDVRGRVISHGLHYVPGPDTCTLCICDNGQAKVCKAVLCSPPHDCRSFRVGSTCCEFICLDDVVKPAEGLDMNMRVTAGAAAAIVIMTVILVVYKVRKQKRRRPTHGDDQRSLTSIGYISGSMAYVGGACETGLPAFKPPGNCVPRGEAPPPYEEVVAQSRAETMRISDPPYHRSYPTTVEQLARGEEPHLAPMSLAQCGGGLPVGPCNGHAYANLPRPITQMANTQNCYNAPLLQPQQPLPESREQHNPLPHHLLAPNMSVGYPSAIRLTGSLGAISNRGLLSLLQREPAGRERSHHAPGMYPLHTELHRTIPRISTAIDTTILDTSIGFNRADRSLQNEIRRSFHKPSDNTRHIFTDTGRSMPRNLNLASNAELSRAEPMVLESNPQGSRRSRAHSDDTVVGGIESKPLVRATNSTNSSNSSKSTQQPDQPMSGPQTTLPLTVDQPSCVCSYDGTHEHGAEDPEDYRSECENCKSASSSRWMLEEGWVEEASDGTQTLQRRAPPPAPPPPATATLPQPVTKQNRSLMGPPSNWENWFNTIPDSDTESEEE